MADSPAFNWICVQLEESTTLDRLEARGTVRLALKTAGLTAAAVSPDQMRVVIEKLLPGELLARGVERVDEMCAAWVSGVQQIESGDRSESPDDVFRRLGGD